jgi:hypothetical protein
MGLYYQYLLAVSLPIDWQIMNEIPLNDLSIGTTIDG